MTRPASLYRSTIYLCCGEIDLRFGGECMPNVSYSYFESEFVEDEFC